MKDDTESEILVKWNRFVALLDDDNDQRKLFIEDPTEALIAARVLDKGQVAVVKTRELDSEGFDVAVFASESMNVLVVELVLPSIEKLDEYFELLPKPPGTVVAGPGCAIPGGCSGSF